MWKILQSFSNCSDNLLCYVNPVKNSHSNWRPPNNFSALWHLPLSKNVMGLIWKQLFWGSVESYAFDGMPVQTVAAKVWMPKYERACPFKQRLPKYECQCIDGSSPVNHINDSQVIP